MNWGRASGILLHITSLPGRFGIGDLGTEAFRFADWLAEAGQRVWQVLPLGPVGYGESPYQMFSAFAGNPLLVSIDSVIGRGWLDQSDVLRLPKFAQDSVQFERVIPWKTKILRRAFERFRERAGTADREIFAAFKHENRAWLIDYAQFMAFKHAQGSPWWEWLPKVEADAWEVEYHEFVQFEFSRQWQALREYCATRGIYLMGDLSIYVSRDSADVWKNPGLFRSDVVAGVPPDYFSATGQLWGNPIYNWEAMAAEGYRWWVSRMRAALQSFDAIRVDHFRGFESYWEVPATESTAVNGRWVKGPGANLFRALETQLGTLPIVAENLGVITPEVESLRHEFGLPGMAVLQFAFGPDSQARTFQPHNYIPNLVAYTGTHDNNTSIGWWRSEGGDSTRTAENIQAERAKACSYLATDGLQMNWVLIRALMMSVADTVLVPLQDVLGLGSAARMNTPATLRGNWRWRFRQGALTEKLATRLRDMVHLYERGPASAAPAD